MLRACYVALMASVAHSGAQNRSESGLAQDELAVQVLAKMGHRLAEDLDLLSASDPRVYGRP